MFLLFDRADTRYEELRGLEIVLHYGRCKKAWLGLPASVAWVEGHAATSSLRAEGRCQRMDRAVALGSDGGLRRRVFEKNETFPPDSLALFRKYHE